MLKKKETILNLRNGYKFKVLDKDAMLPTIEEVWIKKVYGELDILRDITKPIVIDVGANIGCFSLFAWSKNKESQIFAIEPEKNNFQILQDNIALNDASAKIFSFNLAMSSESGVKKLYLDKETNSGKNSFFGSGRYAEVNCISLENFFIDRNISHCDLLKMDIEGGEYDVLYNTKNEIFSKIKNIILEWHIISGVDGPDALKIFLENKGYKVFIKNELVIANR